MTNTYDTSAEPLGSTAVRVLYNNASNLDDAVNSNLDTWIDRPPFGRIRRTWWGMEQAFNQFLIESGFETTHLIYVDGTPLQVDRPTQLIDRAGSVYRVKLPASFPVLLTGTWATDAPKLLDVGDQSLRIALAASTGGTLVGQGSRTVSDNLEDAINVKNYGALNTPAATLATFTAALAAADAAGKAIIVPAGTYTFVDIPNFAKSNRHMYADGRVVLKSTGTGWAMDMTSGASNFYNFRMIGDWIVEGNASNTGGVHIQALHHSQIELRAMNVPGRAFQINYGVLTSYKLTASINVGPPSEWVVVPTLGLYLDGRNAGEFTSASWFDLRIEGINGVGVDIISAQQCAFTGTSEHNANIGIRTGVGSRYNTFNNIDIEQNLANDLWIGGYSDLWLNTTCRSTAVTNNIEVVSGAEGNQFWGGDLRCANMNNGSFGTHFQGCRLSDSGSLGLKGTGGYTHANCVRYNVSGVVTSRYSTKFGTSGTFTPAFAGLTTAGTHTYSTQSGYFTDTGDHIEGEIFLAMTAKDAAMAGNIVITGLPYPADSSANRYASGSVAVHGNITAPSAPYTNLAWRIAPGATSITLLASGYGAAVASVASASITATTTVTFTFRYPKPVQL